MNTMPNEKTETLVMLPVLTVEMEGGEQAIAVVVCCSVLLCFAVCVEVCSICVAAYYSVLHCVAVYCNVLQCVAVCCSLLQCVAVSCSVC